MKLLSNLVLFTLIAFSSYSQIDNAADDSTWNEVEKEASFTGGDPAWRKFLQQNLRGEVAAMNGAPSGTYTVIVQFIVDKEGNISDIKALTNWGYGLEAEVVRVIRSTPKWKPAIQNGRPVKAYRRQPVTFVLQEDGLDVSIKNSDCLYIGKNNVVTIDADKARQDDLRVTISQGTIEEKGGTYTVRVTTPGRAIIEVYNKHKKLGAYSFEVKALPK